MSNKKKIILAIVVVIIIVVTIIIFWSKLGNNLLGKKEGSVEETEQAGPQVKKVITEFSGEITNIDFGKESIVVKWIDIAQKKAVDLTFLINNSTEITLANEQEKISFQDLQLGDIVVINTSSDKGGDLVANNIKVTVMGTISAKVVSVEKGQITVVKNFGRNNIPETIYKVIVGAETKFFIKDYTKVLSSEGKSFDPSKIVEKSGTLTDIKKDADVVVWAKDGKIPRKAGDFEASKIEIILN